MTLTDDYIQRLQNLKEGQLGLLRAHSGRDLDYSLEAFDLFTGLWWPLREKNQRAPQREIAWLIAKLYARCPLPHLPGHTIARRLRSCQPPQELARESFRRRFDFMLQLSVDEMEDALFRALRFIADRGWGIDWVCLTDDLSRWDNEATRLRWAEQYLGTKKGHSNAD